MLPSEVLSRSNTLDLLVLNTAAKWQKKMQEQQNGKSKDTTQKNYSTQELMEIHKKRKQAREKR